MKRSVMMEEEVVVVVVMVLEGGCDKDPERSREI